MFSPPYTAYCVDQCIVSSTKNWKGALATISASWEFQLSLKLSSKPHHSDAAGGFEPNTDFSNVRARKIMLTKPPRTKLKMMITDPGSVEGR